MVVMCVGVYVCMYVSMYVFAGMLDPKALQGLLSKPRGINAPSSKSYTNNNNNMIIIIVITYYIIIIIIVMIIII